MMFFIKKLISAWLLPLPVSLILIVLGLFFLRFNHKKTSFSCISAGALILIIASLNITANLLIRPLEHRYPILRDPPLHVHFIVVLGASTQGAATIPANLRLNAGSMARLIEAVRLYHLMKKHHQHPVLLLSGGRVFNAPSSAEIMGNMAQMLGISQKYIKIEKGSKDTYQEAMYLKNQLKAKPFILVTSAYHMPRSMALFEKQGLHPIAAPTQLLSDRYRYQQGRKFAPRAANLARCDLAIHEYLGLLWSKLNSQI